MKTIEERIEAFRKEAPPVPSVPNLNEVIMEDLYRSFAIEASNFCTDGSVAKEIPHFISKFPIAWFYFHSCFRNASHMKEIGLQSQQDGTRPLTVRREKGLWNKLGTDELQLGLFNRITDTCLSSASKPTTVERVQESMPTDRNELISQIMWHDGAKLIDEDCRVFGLTGEKAYWNDRKVRAVDYCDGKGQR
jgi:hypothetical protein